jgi:hypothetical protein
MIIRAAIVERLIDTILVTLIALTFTLAFTEPVVGTQIGVRLLYVSLVIVALLCTQLNGLTSSEESWGIHGMTRLSDEHGKPKNTPKQIKPILPSIIGKK